MTTSPSRNFILVLDDYHMIDSEPIDRALTFLLDHLPPQMHLVIATREDPSLPLPRYRVRGQLTELRAADLRFTPAEAGEFLNHVMGLNLSAEDIAALETRTEGWIARLAISRDSRCRGLKTPPVLSNLSPAATALCSIIWPRKFSNGSPSVCAILMQTAILDRLVGSLCDAVTAQDGSRGMLETLERGNLFVIPLDDQRQWYRYHHLFADVLQAHLSRGAT